MTHGRRSREQGYLLLQAYGALALLAVFALIVAGSAFTEARIAQAQHAQAQALYLAEAGIDRSIAALRDDPRWTAGFSQEPYGDWGHYSVAVEPSGTQWTLTSVGAVTAGGQSQQRTVTAVLQRALPANFYGNAIYSADAVTFHGNSYQVTGNVLSGTHTPVGSRVAGQLLEDPTANPLPALDYRQLHDLASAQGHVYDAARLQDVQNHRESFPASFWRTPPTDPHDPTTGVPNIIYVTTTLALNGNLGTIGGFFVVVGDVLTDPDDVEDATINGNGTVQGAIYTRGTFRVNGGGNGLNVNGGVWAGREARLNGNATVQYDRQYMDALQGLLQADVEMVLWREGQ